MPLSASLLAMVPLMHTSCAARLVPHSFVQCCQRTYVAQALSLADHSPSWSSAGLDAYDKDATNV